jgi:hypothetical protein
MAGNAVNVYAHNIAPAGTSAIRDFIILSGLATIGAAI